VRVSVAASGMDGVCRLRPLATVVTVVATLVDATVVVDAALAVVFMTFLALEIVLAVVAPLGVALFAVGRAGYEKGSSSPPT
jgi:hypothetical protein